MSRTHQVSTSTAHQYLLDRFVRKRHTVHRRGFSLVFDKKHFLGWFTEAAASSV